MPLTASVESLGRGRWAGVLLASFCRETCLVVATGKGRRVTWISNGLLDGIPVDAPSDSREDDLRCGHAPWQA
jgi:hypothetical protein